MTTLSRQQQGAAAEDNACRYLEQQGLRLIERNYRCRLGEVDLIMEEGKSTVFVEVRFRSNPNYGSGAESVDYRKQQKLIATASHYLQKYPQRARQPARFDVISIGKTSPQANINWIQNAFQAS